MSGKRKASTNETEGGNKKLLSDRIELNPQYAKDQFLDRLTALWKRTGTSDVTEETDTSAQFHKTPFPCCFLSHFVNDSSYMEDLKQELLSLDFHDKNNDLYKFQQSQDLKALKKPKVSSLKEFLYENFREWLIKITGIPLNNTMDMSCAQYNHTDVLLCHDDELEGRRIAYILYLVPEEWEQSDGGTLDLFSCDDQGQPVDIVKSLVPQWNSFVFFEVTPTSYHQVSEVLAESKCRLSISGWFHGPPIKRPVSGKEKHPLELSKPEDMEEEDFYAWINPSYLDPGTQGDIQTTFEENSEIQLHEFLLPEKFAAVSKALREEGKWVAQGPAHKRHYEALVENSPPILKECMEFFRSEAFFLVLSNLTGLKLHALAPDNSDSESEDGHENGEQNETKSCDPRCRLEWSRWKQGAYTLLNDDEADNADFALDAFFFANARNWNNDCGGQINYIAKGEDEELLTVCPEENCLALAYRDKETLRFVKHINSKIARKQGAATYEPEYHCLTGVYYENPPELLDSAAKVKQ